MREKLIDVWEIWPHWDSDVDYLLTDDGDRLEEYVGRVTESWADTGPEPGTEFTITIKVKEMRRDEYKKLTATQP